MQFYSKLIAAVIGLLVIVGTRYGLNLAEHQQTIIDAVTAIATAASVYFIPNKPTTAAQVDTVRATTNEAAAEIRDA